MTDPLRPFAEIIRALWQSRAKGTGRAQVASNPAAAPSAAGVEHRSRSPEARESLQSRLRARIARADAGNPRKLRETFVETAILFELGEQVARDPAFGEMVTRISDQLASDPDVGERLHRLLMRLSSGAQEY